MYGLVRKSIIPEKYAGAVHNPTCTLTKTVADYIQAFVNNTFTYKYRQLRQV